LPASRSVAAGSNSTGLKSKRDRISSDEGFDKKSLHQVKLFPAFSALRLQQFTLITLKAYFGSLLLTLGFQLKSLLTARGIPFPPADQLQKDTLVEMLQASVEESALADGRGSCVIPSGIQCISELEQLHHEIIEQTSLLRADSIKNPVKAQALRRLTTALADMGLSSLSSNIPPSQSEIKRFVPGFRLFIDLYYLHYYYYSTVFLIRTVSFFATTRVLNGVDRQAILSCCSSQHDLGAAEMYFYRALNAGPFAKHARVHQLICYLTIVAVISLRPIIASAPAEVPSKDLHVQMLIISLPFTLLLQHRISIPSFFVCRHMMIYFR
jgi:hypothetical protein